MIPLLAVLATCALFAANASNNLRTLTTAREAHDLTLRDARRAYPIHLLAVVTYYDPNIDHRRAALFVHDATGAVFVAISTKPGYPIPAGALVDVTGVSAAGDFAPIVDHGEVRVVGESHLPPEAPLMTLSHLLTGGEDGQWVEMEGVVRSARPSEKDNIVFELATPEGNIGVITLPEPGIEYEGLVDAKVRIRGNAGPAFNRLGQLTGFHLFMPSIKVLRVEDPAPADPFRAPVRPVGSLLRFEPNTLFRRRVHVRGRVTMLWPSRSICIQDETQGICAQTTQTKPIHLGDVADVIGFPTIGDFGPTLADSTFRPTGRSEPEQASLITAEEALRGDHEAQLVQVEGKVIGEDQAATDPTLLLASGKFVFPAILPASGQRAELSTLKVGTTLRVKGICSVLADHNRTVAGGNFSVPASFRILLRSPQDVMVVARPSWWTAGHVLLLLAGALALTLGVLFWGVVLRRRVQQQTGIIREQLQMISTQLREASKLKEVAEAANRRKAIL